MRCYGADKVVALQIKIWVIILAISGMASASVADFDDLTLAADSYWNGTAMTKLDSGQPYYLEYSFAEPYYFVVNGKPDTSWGHPSPSIHFRHNQRANIAWCDGHVGAKDMAVDDTVNVYGVRSYDVFIGWFGSLDNSLYDLK